MRLAIISDLHLDHWIRHYNLSGIPNMKREMLNEIIDRVSEDVNFVLIAGDFWDGAVEKLDTRTLSTHVITVWGNHDYYYEDWPESSDSVQTYLATSKDEPLDISIATLWTEFKGATLLPPTLIYQGISDSRLIRNASWEKVAARQQEELAQLQQSDADIIMTHFPPSYRSCASKFVGDPYNPYFLNQLDRMEFKATLWVCGHVHHKHSYMMGNTLVVCNPLGYPYEKYSDIKDYQPVIVERDDSGWRIVD